MSVSAPRRERWTVRILLLTCAIVTIGSLPAVSALGQSTQSAEGVRALVNDARRSASLAGLPLDQRVAAIARDHAARMRDRGRIYHNPNVASELDGRGVDWSRWGENVGVGPSTEDVHDGFMESSTHRANILDSGFNAIGTGVAVGENGRVYVAQVFAIINASQPTQPAASAQPVRAVAPQEPARVVPAETSPQDVVPAAPDQPASSNAPAAVETPDHVLAEDGSSVPLSFYGADHCGSAFVIAEDGTIVPLSFYGEAPYC